MLINTPEAIHRVLVENTGNYRRTPAAIRILRPVTGYGVLLSEGDSWRRQRRTIAPSMAPRVIPMLARHIAAVAQETVASLNRRRNAPLNLLHEMQFAALEIAGRSMFSLEMAAFGPEMRALLTGYGLRLSQPHLLDMLLPPSIPAPRDFARWRFQRRWMALVNRIIDARLASGENGARPDLFDLLRAARDPETGAAFTREQLHDQVATMIVAGPRLRCSGPSISSRMRPTGRMRSPPRPPVSTSDPAAPPPRSRRSLRPALSSARRCGSIRLPLR
jgi:unspecific monooxygenase